MDLNLENCVMYVALSSVDDILPTALGTQIYRFTATESVKGACAADKVMSCELPHSY